MGRLAAEPEWSADLRRSGLSRPDESAPDALLALDADLNVSFWSPAAELLYGIRADAALGRAFDALVSCHPSGPPHVPGLDARFESMGLVNGPAIHLVRGAGRGIPVKVSVVAFPRTVVREDAVLVVARDDAPHLMPTRSLGERREFEILLSEMSSRFTGLAEEEVDGEIRLWLGRLVEMLGVDRSTFSELTHPGGLTVTHSYAMPGIQTHPPGPAAGTFPWLTGELAAGRVVALTRIPEDLPDHAVEERRVFLEVGMKAAIGIPVSVAGSLVCALTFGAIRRPRSWSPEVVSRLHLAGQVFANAIARRQAKQRLEQKRKELAHLGRVADMGKLASVIAHELDQPLTAVVTNAQAVRTMLQAPEPDLAEADDALSDVIDAGTRISEIIQRERRLLRKSEGVFEHVNLNDALREVELFIRADARQCGARVVIELLPGLSTVLGDRVELQQVALNLARNALQAVRQQPAADREVTIRTASGAAEVVLSVADSGPPLEESVLEKMFEPFFTTKANGLGIGLSISKSIVEAHRGRIWATRNPGGGLTVGVSIPRE